MVKLIGSITVALVVYAILWTFTKAAVCINTSAGNFTWALLAAIIAFVICWWYGD